MNTLKSAMHHLMQSTIGRIPCAVILAAVVVVIVPNIPLASAEEQTRLSWFAFGAIYWWLVSA